MPISRIPVRLTCVTVFWVSLLTGARSSTPDYSAPGPADVEIVRTEWQDTERNRTIPVKIYLPKAKAGEPDVAAPVIVFSHGLGGSRDGYEYLGRQWASHGFVSVHIQHPGSDESVWKGKAQPMVAMRAAAADRQNAINRPKDVSFAVDQLLKANAAAEGPLHGRLDPERIGAGGHSFGAYTVLAIAGQSSAGYSARDERIKAGVAMSAPVVQGARNVTFEPIHIPVFHFTGTRDEVPLLGSGSPADRRIPFDRITAPSQFLLIFAGGDHMIFGGRSSVANAPEMLNVIRGSTTAFWDAYLKGDQAARGWLTSSGGFASSLGTLGEFERKGMAP